MKLSIITVSLAFCVLRLAFCGEASPEVRVAVMQDVSSFRLKVNGFYRVETPADKANSWRGKGLNTTVTVSKEGILLGNAKSRPADLFIKPDKPGTLSVNNRVFLGSIRLIKKDNGRLSIINHVGLEDYVKGILYHEASHYWPMPALEAQAIACRTYAVYQARESRGKEFDLTGDTYSQVYGGRTSERYRTNIAVRDTAGKILTWQGEVFPAYYHATCGGHTEDASLVWNTNIPVLRGLSCNFCKDSPHFQWHYCLSADEAAEKLSSAGFKLEGIREIKILGRDDSGRVTGLELVSDQRTVRIPAKDFRIIIGSSLIRSTNFNVSASDGDFIFEGLGWGHGVGLCQWGAYFMAKDGKSAEEILSYYYPGAEITSLKR